MPPNKQIITNDARTAKLMPLPYDAIELLVTPDFFSGSSKTYLRELPGGGMMNFSGKFSHILR